MAVGILAALRDGVGFDTGLVTLASAVADAVAQPLTTLEATAAAGVPPLSGIDLLKSDPPLRTTSIGLLGWPAVSCFFNAKLILGRESEINAGLGIIIFAGVILLTAGVEFWPFSFEMEEGDAGW